MYLAILFFLWLEKRQEIIPSFFVNPFLVDKNSKRMVLLYVADCSVVHLWQSFVLVSIND